MLLIDQKDPQIPSPSIFATDRLKPPKNNIFALPDIFSYLALPLPITQAWPHYLPQEEGC
jgi:hypothetical protein